MSLENTQNLMVALTNFGFGSLGLTAENFQKLDQIIQLGYPPSRIDLITTPDGIDFETCYQSKIEVIVDNISVNFIKVSSITIFHSSFFKA